MIKKLIAITAFSLFFYCSNANASNVKILGEYDDWVAYSYVDVSGKVCYMASTPKKEEGKYTKRGDIYALVTHRPRDKSFDTISIVAGYRYGKNAKATLRIGKKDYNLFTEKDRAWATNENIDKQIVKSMKNGYKMIIHGKSNRGTKTKDTYSLKGFSNAYKAISKACPKK